MDSNVVFTTIILRLTSVVSCCLKIPLTILVNIDSNNEWVASNVDEGHLDYYFYLLAALMMVAELGFMYMSSGYKYADPEVLEELSHASQAKQDERLSMRSVSGSDRNDLDGRKPLLSVEYEGDE